MTKSTKTFTVPRAWAARHISKIANCAGRFGKYRKGWATISEWRVDVDNADTATVVLTLTHAARPRAKFLTPGQGTRSFYLYPLGDVRKILKMLTVAERRCPVMA